MSKKYVYDFGEKRLTPGNTLLLGNKGVQLSEMTALGVPVPPGFTISTETCIAYLETRKWMPGLEDQVEKAVRRLEKKMDRQFGNPSNPLMVSVRSGSYVSMPGMMDTVLNLGLNDAVVEGIIEKTNNARFAYDIYRRFIDMFGDVVMGCDHEHFEARIDAAKKKAGVALDSDLSAGQLKEVVEEYKKVYREHVGKLFPQDPRTQLTHAINAVFNSWNSDRAVKYRKINNLRGDAGTAVNVQAMVFGNMGEDCGTGVCFTRNPSTGQKEFYGEFLMNAQGEDVVAGIRTPMELKQLSQIMPKAYKELTRLMSRLEKHYQDMQDIEFTIQERKLYILQTRTGKRTAEAAVRIAADMVAERLISRKEAVTRVTPAQLDHLLHPHFDPKAERKAIARGLPASPGAAVGRVVFTAADAEAWKDRGNKVVLVRKETSPEDIGGMDAAQGILTSFGGMTSHAAVVARGMGKCCVAGVGSVSIDYRTRHFTVGRVTVKEGDWISLDGSTGEVMLGQLPTVEPTLSGYFGKFMKICDEVRTLGIRTNADTPADSKRARDFGAEGIGLTRTEHMFFEGDRIWPVRQMILAADGYAAMLDEMAAAADDDRKKAIENEHARVKQQFEGALAELLPLQRGDFEGIFEAMAGLPVTIRLLDPPLHEFLPQDEQAQAEMARRLGVEPEVVKAKVEQLHEFNPMLGHRGCRLAVTYPPIYRMQARAIIEAALSVRKKGKKVLPEIMIPLVGAVAELKSVKDEIVDEIKVVFKEKKSRINYLVGTMIEVPRAALTADEIAQEAEFFSFGTNDLTQMTMGFSRDDAGKFLAEYVSKGIYSSDPFQKLDQTGVGKLVEMGTRLGRKTRKKLKVGICGEHGGEPSSIEFCHRVGMNYVSCSPFRVPIARLAAAQAAVQKR